MKPSIGRQVHYYSENLNNPVRSATIVRVVADDGTVDLAVMVPTPSTVLLEHKEDVKFAEDYSPGCWSWPPRV